MSDRNPMFDRPTFAGKCAGVDLVDRGDGHILFELCVEDDELWHRQFTMSSSWIDELIEQLQKARDFIQTQTPDITNGRQYGFKFK